jgi:hypothetical protein
VLVSLIYDANIDGRLTQNGNGREVIDGATAIDFLAAEVQAKGPGKEPVEAWFRA